MSPIDWARIEGRAWTAPTFTDDQIAAAQAAVKALPSVDGDPNHIALPWKLGDKFPDISQLDFGDAMQQVLDPSTLLAATDHAWLNRAKVIAHLATPGEPVRMNPFTCEPLLVRKRKGDVLIVDGHHRIAALMFLGVKKYQFWIVPTSAAVKAQAP